MSSLRSAKWLYTVRRVTPARRAISATVVWATPFSSCSSAAALAIRSRVSRWLSARAFSSYFLVWVDTVFIHVTLSRRSLNTLFSERRDDANNHPLHRPGRADDRARRGPVGSRLGRH